MLRNFRREAIIWHYKSRKKEKEINGREKEERKINGKRKREKGMSRRERLAGRGTGEERES